MSSSDTPIRPRRPVSRAAAFVGLGLAGLLAACNVQPMYGSLSGGPKLADTLAGVAVDPVPDRIGQQLRNELVYRLSGAAEPVEPRYRLAVTVDRSTSNLGIQQISGAPTARVLTVSADYRLLDADTGKELTRGRSFADASYDFSNQRYANLRAERDAEDRAAITVANDINIKVAAYLANAR